MAKFVLSDRGTRKLIHNGYGYTKRRERPDCIMWKCEKSNSSKCRAYAKTVADVDDGGDVEIIGTHTHTGNESRYEILLAKNALKRKAAALEEKPVDIVSDVLNETSVLAAAGLKTATLMRSVHRYREMAKKKNQSNTTDLGDASESAAAADEIATNGYDDEAYVAVEEIVHHEYAPPPSMPQIHRQIPIPIVRRGLRTFGPGTNSDRVVIRPITSSPRKRLLSASVDDASFDVLEKSVLLMKKRVLENELKLQAEKKALHVEQRALMAEQKKLNAEMKGFHTEKKATMVKFNAALDEFRRYVAEQRMISRGVDLNSMPVDVPPGMEGLLGE